MYLLYLILTQSFSKATEDSILAVQVFDQKKFKKKDQGFLGVINIRIGDVIELADGADGTAYFLPSYKIVFSGLTNHHSLRPDAHARP